MDDHVFSKMCDQISGYFDRPKSYESRFKGTAWDECRNWPNACADFIAAHFKALDRWPSNVAREFGLAWGHYREANPQVCARIEAVQCSVCGGRGWLEYVEWRGEPDALKPFTGSCLCGHCRRDPMAWTVEQCAKVGRLVVENALAECVSRMPGRVSGEVRNDFMVHAVNTKQPETGEVGW